MIHAHTISLILSSFQKPFNFKFEIPSISKILLKVEISNKNQVLKENFCVPEKSQTCILKRIKVYNKQRFSLSIQFFISLK